ncbi:hypothetical protein BDK88_1170 [Natrinema hispanicum]|uniref:Uncharacterized protein n=1 Tax=Natrinema hispanicum TaxID=392421 RepID=A0A482YK20_9EURY|nr:hypothetical protein BDK88_1170 [Natrinema hispanicum]
MEGLNRWLWPAVLERKPNSVVTAISISPSNATVRVDSVSALLECEVIALEALAGSLDALRNVAGTHHCVGRVAVGKVRCALECVSSVCIVAMVLTCRLDTRPLNSSFLTH